MTGDARHLDAAALRTYLGSHVPLAQTVAGQGDVRLLYEPGEAALGIELDWDGVTVELDAWAHLSAPRVIRGGHNRQQCWVHGRDRLVAGYALLRAISDRVQLHGAPSSEAILESVAAMGDLLEPASRLSAEREIGLFGELLVLDTLATALGGPAAVSAWKGAHREEHDFGLSDGDVEVKTTFGERRRHWIHGKGQLTPSPGVALYLLSIQLTDGGAAGKTLGEQVTELRVRFAGPAAADFDDRLIQLGWLDSQSHRYVRRLRLRSVPLAYLITPDFPRLDDDALTRAGLQSDNIPDVNYLMDLSGRTPTDGPSALGGLLSTGVEA